MKKPEKTRDAQEELEKLKASLGYIYDLLSSQLVQLWGEIREYVADREVQTRRAALVDACHAQCDLCRKGYPLESTGLGSFRHIRDSEVKRPGLRRDLVNPICGASEVRNLIGEEAKRAET